MAKGYSFDGLAKLAEAAVKRSGDTMTGTLQVPSYHGIKTGADGDGANIALSMESKWALFWRQNNSETKSDEFIGIYHNSALIFRQDKGLGDKSYADQEIYHEGRKPTPSELGVVARAGDTMTGDLIINSANTQLILQNEGVNKWTMESVAGVYKITEMGVSTRLTLNPNNGGIQFNGGYLRHSGEIQSSYANAFRMTQGDHGVFWRNDGTHLYLMKTASGDAYGTYDTTRPMTMVLDTGEMSFGEKVKFNKPITIASSTNSLGSPGDLEFNNGRITGLNTIVFGDDANSTEECIMFPKPGKTDDSTVLADYDRFWLKNGEAYINDMRIPHIGSGIGVMEVGQMIDFKYNNSAADYDIRLDATTADKFTVHGATEMYINSGKVYHTGFKPTATDVGALPITGGTVTGDLTAKISGAGGVRLDSTSTGGVVGFLRPDGTNYFNIMAVDLDYAKLSFRDAAGNALYDFLNYHVASGETRLLNPVSASAQGSGTNALTRKDYVDGKFSTTDSNVSGKVSKTGDTMTGDLHFNKASGGMITFDHDPNQLAYMQCHDGNVRTMFMGIAATDGTVQLSNKNGVYLNLSPDRVSFSHRVSGGVAVDASDLTRKDYVDGQIGTRYPKSGGPLSGDLILDAAGSDSHDIIWRKNAGTECGRLWLSDNGGNESSLAWRAHGTASTRKIYHQGFKPTYSEVGAMPSGGFHTIQHKTMRVVYTNTTGYALDLTICVNGLTYNTNSLVDGGIRISGSTGPVTLSIKNDGSGEYDDYQKVAGSSMVPITATYEFFAHEAITGVMTIYSNGGMKSEKFYIDPDTFEETGIIRAFEDDEQRDTYAPNHVVEVTNLPENWSHTRYRLRAGGVWEERPEYITRVNLGNATGMQQKGLNKAIKMVTHFDMLDEPEAKAQWKSYYRELSNLDKLPEWPLVDWPTEPGV